jgi:hypothetical protein
MVLRVPHQLVEVGERAKTRIHVAVIGHVIAAVGEGEG